MSGLKKKKKLCPNIQNVTIKYQLLDPGHHKVLTLDITVKERQERNGSFK